MIIININDQFKMTESSPIKIVLQTASERWVIPHNCLFLKMLIKEQSITPYELLFESSRSYQCFVKQLFLMATIDEQHTQEPSILAGFARHLIKHPHNHNTFQGNNHARK